MEKGSGKTVSVIVPVYNGEKYLERCMKSLLCQTWEHLEILLIDDGSVDKSGQLCDSFVREFGNERVRAIHTENQGVSAARNLGLDICKGKYVTFVDADDCLAEDMVEHLVCLLEETGSDVAGCAFWTFGQENAEKMVSAEDAEEILSYRKMRHGSCTFIKQAEILDGLGFMEKGILQSDTRCWSKLYRRESIGGLRFEKGLTIGEDMLFLLELARAGKQFARSGYKGYGYFMNEEGAMMHGFRDSYMDQILCWEKALAIMEEEAPMLKSKAEAVLLVSAMLVAGKLAVLSRRERKQKREYVESCSRIIREYGCHQETFRELDKGYKIKVAMYRYIPGIYLGMYHWRAAKIL